jgi:hypothetical protein
MDFDIGEEQDYPYSPVIDTGDKTLLDVSWDVYVGRICRCQRSIKDTESWLIGRLE